MIETIPATVKKVLITVHGVMSDNAGFENLGKVCANRVSDLYHWPFYYKYTTAFEMLSQDQRELLCEHVRTKFIVVRQEIELQHERKQRLSYPEVTVVAHSFGTMATLRAFQSGLPGLTIENLVLLGSIIRPSEVWSGHGGLGLLTKSPLNIARPFDKVVHLGKAIGGGLSGTRGFILTGPYAPTNTFKDGGHTAYDPDDFEDIANLMNGIPCQLVPFDDFRNQIGLVRKARLWIRRTTKRS